MKQLTINQTVTRYRLSNAEHERTFRSTMHLINQRIRYEKLQVIEITTKQLFIISMFFNIITKAHKQLLAKYR